MGAKEVLEPVLVLSCLAVGVWINRESRNSSSSHRQDSLSPSPIAAADWDKDDGTGTDDRERLLDKPGFHTHPRAVYRTVAGFDIPSRDTRQYSHNWGSRLLRRFPFLVEVVLWALVYGVYQFGRGLVAVFVNDQQTKELAKAHAVQVLHVEAFLHLDWERAVQGWFLERPALLEILTRVYSWVHIPATILFFGWFYASERHAVFARARRTLAMANLLAFIVFSLYPCMPPRLLPKEFGFVDAVLRSSVRSIYNHNKYQNQYAAMPSLHFGYSFVIGICVYLYAKVFGGKLNILAFSYPALILLTIVATANHYLLDAVAGAIVCGVAYQLNNALVHLLLLQDYVLYVLHLHRPPVDDGEEDELLHEVQPLRIRSPTGSRQSSMEA